MNIDVEIETEQFKLLKKKLLEGKLIGGDLPLGYGYALFSTVDKKRQKQIIVDPFYGPIMQEAFALCSLGIFNIEEIATLLNEKHSITLKSDSLSRALRNPFYCGYIKFKNELYLHNHPKLVQEDIFKQIQSIKIKASVRFKKNDTRFLYRGLIRCHECGCLLTPYLQKKQYIYYSCSKAIFPHSAPIIREELITESLKEVFEKFNFYKPIQEGNVYKIRLFFRCVFEYVKVKENREIIYKERETITPDLVDKVLHKITPDIAFKVFKKQTAEEVQVSHSNPILHACLQPKTIEELSTLLQKDIFDIQLEVNDLELQNLIEQDMSGRWKTL